MAAAGSGLKAWKVDLDSIAADRKSNIDPPGYDATIAREAMMITSASQKKKDHGLLQRKQAALFARATGPIKQIAFMCFMAYMTGNSIQIFSIIMTFGLLASPITSILNCAKMFPKEPDWPQLDVLPYRLMYCLVQCAQLIFGLYKLNGMGLLPVYASDWVSSLKVPQTLEHSYAPIQ